MRFGMSDVQLSKIWRTSENCISVLLKINSQCKHRVLLSLDSDPCLKFQGLLKQRLKQVHQNLSNPNISGSEASRPLEFLFHPEIPAQDLSQNGSQRSYVRLHFEALLRQPTLDLRSLFRLELYLRRVQILLLNFTHNLFN